METTEDHLQGMQKYGKGDPPGSRLTFILNYTCTCS